MGGGGWQRLGREIAAQRARYGWTAADLAAYAGLGVRTIEIIEAGTHAGQPRRSTLTKIEQALDWADEDCERILGGGRARVRSDPRLDRIRGAWRKLTAEQQATVVALVDTLIKQR